MVKEDYTNFELSKKLKEIGFPQWNDNPEEYHPYVEGYDHDGHDTNIFSSNRKLEYSKVPLSLVQKWLREEKELSVEITMHSKFVASYGIFKITNKGVSIKGSIPRYDTDYDTYEQALSAGIDKCIEILKEEKS